MYSIWPKVFGHLTITPTQSKVTKDMICQGWCGKILVPLPEPSYKNDS